MLAISPSSPPPASWVQQNSKDVLQSPLAGAPRGDARQIEEIRVGLGRYPAHKVDIRPVSTQAGFHIAAFLTAGVSRSPDRTTRYRRGDLAFVDLSRPLSAEVAACTCITATMSRVTLSDIFAGAPSLPPIRIRRETVSTTLLRRTLASVLRSQGAFGSAQSAALSGVLMSLIEDALYDGAEPSHAFEGARIRDRIDLSRAIRKGLSDPRFASADALRMMNMTRGEFRSLLAGRAWADVLREHRIRAARTLLHSPASRYLSITDIGRKVGFSSPAQFSTAYATVVGMSPRADRKGEDHARTDPA